MKTCIVCGRGYADNADEHLRNGHIGPFEFWFGVRKYKTSAPSMLVGEIVRMVDASPLNAVFQDRFGAGADTPLAHGAAVDLTREPHFYCVPAAAMYRGLPE
jgi:hypothetical protein